jgi:hypothetical protein
VLELSSNTGIMGVLELSSNTPIIPADSEICV